MKQTNGRARIQFTRQEIEAIRSLAEDRLRGEIASRLKSETLGGLLIKTARARNRIKTLV